MSSCERERGDTRLADEAIAEVLKRARRIAIIGLSPQENKDSFQVGKYLLEHGYEVIPIYPKEEEILHQKVYRDIRDIDGKIDILVIFRKSESIPSIASDVIRRGAVSLLWAQLGIYSKEAEDILKESGTMIVQNRCIKIEHQRLIKP